MKALLLLLLSIGSIQSFAQNGNWCGSHQISENQNLANPYAETGLLIPESEQSFTIPVVIHIVHANGEGNITKAQILDGLNHLNMDFRRENADTANARSSNAAPFLQVGAGMNITFKLAQLDPEGNCTDGIVRVNAPNKSFQADDNTTRASYGGSNPWPQDRYLNIWVVNTIWSTPGVNGYAYLPYWGGIESEHFGIVIRHDKFGTIGTASVGPTGRTLTHEVGHILGLNHTFAAGNCYSGDCFTSGDWVCDTPPQDDHNWYCDSTVNSCSHIPQNDVFGTDVLDQNENFMGYTDCKMMFTQGQVDLMTTNLLTMPYFINMTSDINLAATGAHDLPEFCQVEFSGYPEYACPGEVITFLDESHSNITYRNWSVWPLLEGVDYAFTNGTSASDLSPQIQFFTESKYTISLTVSDGIDTLTVSKEDYIDIVLHVGQIPFYDGFEWISTFDNSYYWSVNNRQGDNAFTVVDGLGDYSNQCAMLEAFNDGRTADYLLTPRFDLSEFQYPDTVTLSFRYAYNQHMDIYPSPTERLSVWASKDCYDSWHYLFGRYANTLTSEVSSVYWEPTQSDWQTVHMNIPSSYLIDDVGFMFKFEGYSCNNLYLDNINIYNGSPSDTIVGIPEIETLTFEAFPNPADDYTLLEIRSQKSGNAVIEIQDLTGKVLSSKAYWIGMETNKIQCDLQHLAQGPYFVSINQDQSKAVKRIIVN